MDTQVLRNLPQAIPILPIGHRECGEPLQRERDGLRKYCVRRFRIGHVAEQKRRVIRPMAVGHRRSVYEELSDRLQRTARG